jgi:hypothetical protein
MSPIRRRPEADAARLGASPSSTSTRSNRPGTWTSGLDGRSTNTTNSCRLGASASAASICRANRPNPRRFARQLPSIPILMAGALDLAKYCI